MRPGETYDALIVLGGLLEERAMAAHGMASYNDNVDRLIAARDVLVNGRAARAALGLPRTASLDTCAAIRELAGRLIYRLRGYSA